MFFVDCIAPTLFFVCRVSKGVLSNMLWRNRGTFGFFSAFVLFSSNCQRCWVARGFTVSYFLEAVVTGMFPSSPRYLASFLSRIGFSIPTSQLFMLVDLHRTTRV